MSERGILGREVELRRLAAAFEEVRSGRGRMFLLLGEPGIGKTRLCDELARIAKGARVAWGRCSEAGIAPAYWPFTQLLRGLAWETPIDAYPELAVLAPELLPGVRGVGGEAKEIRFQLFDGMTRFLTSLARQQPLLLFLDDLHAADEASLRMLQFVLRAIGTSPVMIVGTQRDVAMRTSSEVSAVLHAIGRDSERLALRRLSVAEVEQWIARDEPARAADLATSIHQATEGNPLFVEEVLRINRARGTATPRIPDEVRAALAQHLELADQDTRAVLSVAALIGREFDEILLAQCVEVSRDELRARLERAASVGLIVERGEERHAFVHVLLRDELERAMPLATRADWHFRLGEALARSDDRVAMVRAVHHLDKSGPGHLERLVDVARRASDLASKAFAFDDARAVLDLAVQRLAPGDRRRLALEIEAARAEIMSGEGDAGRARAAQLAARVSGDGELMAEAALVYGAELLGGRTDPQMIQLLENALAALPEEPSSLRARCLARLGSALVPGSPDRHMRALGLAREAIAMSDALGDDETRYRVLQWAIPAVGFTIPASERAPYVRLLVDFAERLDDPVGALRARHLMLIHAVEEGSARSALDALGRTVHTLGRPYYAWRLPLGRAIVALSEGRLDEAKREADSMWQAGGEVGVQWVEPMWALMQLSLMYAYEDPNALVELDPRSDSIVQGTAFRSYFFAWHSAMRRDLDGARRHLAESPQIPTRGPLALAAGEVAYRLGDRALAEKVLDVARQDGEPHKNPFVWGPSGAMCGGPTALVLARCARTVGEVDEAMALLETGIHQCARSFPAHRAQMERDLAELLLERGDRERARDHLARARVLGEQCGMRYFVEHLPTVDAPAKSSSPAIAVSLSREGDTWQLAGLGHTVRLEDRKGVHYLERLLREPNRELHVLDLIGVDDAGDAGAVLDGKAKAAYRARLDTLREELEEARRFGDRGRIEKYEAELDAIAEQLARGVGLGGRDRKAASGAERARVNVQRRLRDVLDRVEKHAPALGRWLTASIRTGTYCSYVPVGLP